MRLCSFGRSGLNVTSSNNATARRCWLAYLAARRRWPSGRLSIKTGFRLGLYQLDHHGESYFGPYLDRESGSIIYYTDDGLCGLLLQTPL